MPRFYFHVRTRFDLVEDCEGSEHVDPAAAISEAIRGARCLMKGELSSGTLCLDQSIEIHDGTGEHLVSVPFGDAVQLVRAGEPEHRQSSGCGSS